MLSVALILILVQKIMPKIGDRVKISKYKNIFAKAYTSNWPEDIFVIKIVKRTVPWTCVISDIDREEVAGMFYEK